MTISTDTASLQALVRDSIDQWRASGESDAAGVLAEHPELRASKSLIMDLVLADFSLRTAAGKPIAKSTFCDRFPTYRQSIVKMLEVQEFLDQCPQFEVDDGRARWPATGDEFLGYEVVEPLGRGGLARVFLARELAVGGRQVVIKISRFGSREAHTLGKLSHPSIVPIHSVQHDSDDGWTVICMPLLGVATAVDLLDAAFSSTGGRRDGQLVARVARETRPLANIAQPAAVADEFAWKLPYADAVARIGLQLAEALAAAHAAGILHRDIKPSNVLLAWSGRALLLDFNLSTDAAAGRQGLGGTLAYMAPELVQCFANGRTDAAGRFDPRCDIYSLGVVLYELLTGRLPAKPDGAESLPLEAYEPWLDAKRQTIAPIGSPSRPLDPRLEAIVRKCVAFDPAERYATAAALAADLQTYLGPTATLRRFTKRHRRAVILAALGMVGSGILLGNYIANRPTELALVYRRGLREYESGKYEDAVKSFTRCLELNSGWPQALFGRAQALRKLGKWRQAHDDFAQLIRLDRPWGMAFCGYCWLRAPNISQAWTDFRLAHEAGLRDVNFLLNHARAEFRMQWHRNSEAIYSQVLEIDPGNQVALRNRGLELVYAARNSKSPTDPQAFLDVREDLRRNPDSKDALLCAAIVFGEAARKDKCFEEDAIEFLTASLKLGMPISCAKRYTTSLKPFLPKVDPAVVAYAEQLPQDYIFSSAPDYHELPDTADWDAFERQYGSKQLIAKGD